MSADLSWKQDSDLYGCPGWCQRVDHDADVVGPGNPPTHYGPEWADGEVTVQATAGTSEAVICVDDETLYVPDPARLRQLAAGMLEAAAWIEARR